MRLPRLSPAAYRRITLVALWLLAFIVVTGAAVRLTGSGLGCSDWPNCEPRQLAPRVGESDYHAFVEFVNRLITGLVSVAVVVAVLGSLARTPRRRDLTWLSLGLVAGVVAQILLGGVVVLTHLNPYAVQGHFVLSALLVIDAVVLHHRAGQPDDGPLPPVVRPEVRRWAWASFGLAMVVVLTGTVVTGSGPHSGANRGQEVAKRLPYTVHEVARIHGIAMVVFLAAVLWTMLLLRRTSAPRAALHQAELLLLVLVLQAAVGYTQYFTGVPPLLVGLHVLGATLVIIQSLHFALGLSAPLVDARESRA